MLSAQDRDQVLKWGQRQLGPKAMLISISEKDFSETDGFVERSGTGIAAREAQGCLPVMSIMADFVENLRDAKEDHMESDACLNGPRLMGRTPAMH